MLATILKRKPTEEPAMPVPPKCRFCKQTDKMQLVGTEFSGIEWYLCGHCRTDKRIDRAAPREETTNGES